MRTLTSTFYGVAASVIVFGFWAYDAIKGLRNA